MKPFVLIALGVALVGGAVIAAVLLLRADAPDLTGADWTIEDIAGRGVVDGSPATLQFLAGGQLAGNVSCNRLIGTYDVAGGNAITLSPSGTTMMACPPALMEQEQRLLALLPLITRYEVDAKTGALLLSAPGGAAILARRP